ncbi:hypothetical protein XENTR_v10018988 [Xenopus tropicalis]|uniref:Olfactory receptor n=1 Tax=Xenopus tropicalis TaxID=8364 RepID=A0A803JGR7_XENTR|nr:olfactory receptor 1020-like [Xenopus tropicalis]KAE8593112.1 hypothetical protein XENTR_v10018988 [Xenopus tropicalis]|eukprot:XP_002937085.2 PREDICTED: olfactory receptor 1020-like [Xenopus tropicalis]
MDKGNGTTVTEFILVGLSEIPEIQQYLFCIFLGIYIITVLGNASIILIYKFSPSLHTPMYYFLSNFSFLEICYVSASSPKMLQNMLVEKKTISFYCCFTQIYSIVHLAGTEFYVLAAMAYDRYNAICHPLLYRIIMNNRVCAQLIAGSWVIGAANSLVHTLLTHTLSFCSNKVNHIFCDVPPLLKLACTDTWINQIVMYMVGGSVTGGAFILIIISYTHILSTILTIHSASGRKKAFSTCTSHLTVVTIFYGSIFFIYLRPKSSYAMHHDRLVAIMYTIVAPLLNPFIYSLRNNDVKAAVRKLLNRRILTWKI